MRRRSIPLVLLVLCAAPVLRAQPAGDGSSRTALTDAAREGVSSLVSARLDRLTDMATTDLAPLDDEAPATNDSGPERAVEAPAGDTPPWPGTAATNDTPWASCDVADGGVQPVELNAGPLLPVQVAMASRGERAVALVALGRPGTDRHGMMFPESRWVAWSDEGAVEVHPARGFLPGAAVALGDTGATVLAYAHPDPRTPAERASHTPDVDLPTVVALTRLDAQGQTLHGPHTLEASNGWQIDSPLVLWRHGTAVVLGHPTAPPGDGGRREVLHFLDARGHDVRAPLELSIDSREAGLGAAPAGLVAAPDGASLAAAWMIPAGPIAGVWVRRGITLDAQPFVPGTAHIVEAPQPPGAPRRNALYPRGMWTFRVAQGEGFWGPSVSRGGVYFARTAASQGTHAPWSEQLFAPWPRARNVSTSRVLASWTDPLPVWTNGGPMVAAFAPRPNTAGLQLVVAYTLRGDRTLRTLVLPVDDEASDAVDVAFTPLDSGALVAWIDGASDDARVRRLEFARVRCARVPSTTAQGAQ